MEGEDARIGVEVFLSNRKPEQTVRYTLSNAEGKKLGTFEGGRTANFRIQNAHLWQGKKGPYLYRCTAELLEGETVLDSVSTSFGCRSFAIDPERGFILNGKEYPLRGVSRHQDRWEVGNALLPEHHREDMDLIANWAPPPSGWPTISTIPIFMICAISGDWLSGQRFLTSPGICLADGRTP